MEKTTSTCCLFCAGQSLRDKKGGHNLTLGLLSDYILTRTVLPPSPCGITSILAEILVFSSCTWEMIPTVLPERWISSNARIAVSRVS